MIRLVKISVEQNRYTFSFSYYSPNIDVVVEGDRVSVNTNGVLVDYRVIREAVDKSLACTKDISKCVNEVQESRKIDFSTLREAVLQAVREVSKENKLGCAKAEEILQALASRGLQVNEKDLTRVIRELRRMGEIYERRTECYTTTDSI